jgi:hypothetical protein
MRTVACSSVPANKRKYEYLLLSFHPHESEIESWEALFEMDKTKLSESVYSLVAREMAGLKESARKQLPRNLNKRQSRRLYLLALPEYEAVLRFIRANIRRPAFKAHLQKLIFQEMNGHALPAAHQITFREAHPGTPPAAQTHEATSLRSPGELFHDANKLIQTMLAELMKPEAERVFDWDAIPPDMYPDSVKSSLLFPKLKEHWDNKNKKP